MDAVRVTWKHGGTTNVLEVKVEHENTFKSDSTAGVWGGTVPEGIQVARNSCRIYAVCPDTFFEELDVVYSLSTGHYFLATHEKVVRVRIPFVLDANVSLEQPEIIMRWH
jgi:hypothetical protein